MNELYKILARNNATFYDYRSGKRTSIYPRLFFIIILAALTAIFTGLPSNNVTNNVITIQAILVGFGFSVLFFLANSDKLDVKENKSLEEKNRKIKVNKISEELFYNISYYNIISILSVLIAFILGLDKSSLSTIFDIFTKITNLPQNYFEKFYSISNIIGYLISGIFYITFFESIYTFCRLVLRVNYYFEQKMKVKD